MSAPSSRVLQRTELKTTGYLATIFALRMFGLFMILPIFAVYGQSLEGATPLLIGTAIGAYGLMQALLQIPFGMLSDRFGRRPLLLIGLLLFVAGGVVAAMSDHIHGVIAGRALQGAGAIASVIMALIGDVVSEKHRTRAMALIGMSVGGSFVLALILGPLLASWLGLSGLFWMTSLMGVFALLVAMVVPAPPWPPAGQRRPSATSSRTGRTTQASSPVVGRGSGPAQRNLPPTCRSGPWLWYGASR